MTVRHSTSKRCPRLSRRDKTEQNKAESLDAERHNIGLGRLPSNGASQGDQGKQGQEPERGTARRKRQLLSGRRPRCPGPLSMRMHPIPGTKQRRHVPRSTLPAGALPRPTSCHIRWAGTQVRLAGVQHRSITSRGKTRRNTLWPNPLTRPKPRVLLSGTTIMDTLIGVLKSP